MSLMELETVTTVPVAPLDHEAFADVLMAMDSERWRHKRRKERNPFWADFSIYVGSLIFVGAGAFCITVGMLR